MTPLHLAFILLIDLLWAANVVTIKLAVADMQPLAMVFLRYLMVAVVCWPFLRWVPGRMPLLFAASTAAGALSMGLAGLGFHLADNVSALAIAGQMGVPFSLLLAVLFFRERISLARMAGIGLAVLGVMVLVFDPAIVHERIGLFLILGSSLFWGLATVLLRRLQGVSPMNIQAWMALISLPLLGGASLLFEPGELARLDALKAETYALVGFSALGASVVGHIGMAWLLQKYPVTTISPLTLPIPLMAVGIALLVFETPLTGQMIIGGLLTMAGMAIITLPGKARSVPEMQP